MSLSNVVVIGLGKMGLPFATYLAIGGTSVVGLDLNEVVVEQVNAGRSSIGPEPGVDEALPGLAASGQLVATTDPTVLKSADVVVVLVPLITVGGVPNFSHLDAAVETIAAHASSDALICFETTLPVGTTRTRFAPILRSDAPERKVVFSPERVQSGEVFFWLERNPKIVGGVDRESEEAGVAFYGSILPVEVRSVDGSDTAEMVKLAETTYRDVNIAFANELARICGLLQIDVSTVIAAANSQPVSHIHEPGIGVGGHCIPHYPYLMLASGHESALVRLGRSVNESMPKYVLGLAKEFLGSLAGKVVLGYGVAYRPGVREHVSSPAFDLRDLVESEGGVYLAIDPLYTDADLEALGFTPWDGSVTPDAHILVTAHDEYLSLDTSRFNPSVFVDGRNRWDRASIESAGHTITGVGR